MFCSVPWSGQFYSEYNIILSMNVDCRQVCVITYLEFLKGYKKVLKSEQSEKEICNRMGVMKVLKVVNPNWLRGEGQSNIKVKDIDNWHIDIYYLSVPSRLIVSFTQVGYIICNMRSTKEAVIGDTFHLKGKPVPPLLDIGILSNFLFHIIYKNIFFLNCT